ncbi:PREDICTED: auxin-responsive protein IAA16-like [Ipomoea nil]|uniref:auxin-responsive protein IAA16-like n=1 Tax=Ipomoea nil TaxID=35883 RepID=UPI000900B4F6|nr:PREDICTED: auxin-responsive protein IAA16-like [Ipomoea nil]
MEEYARKGERYGGGSEEEKLELRLGPPDGGWSSRGREESSSLLSFGYFSNGGKRGFMECVNGGSQAPHKFSSFLQLSSQGHMGVTVKESSQPGCNKGVEVQSCSEKKAPANTTPTAVPNNTSQKRTAAAPVVGWPPLRSFRKNLASSSSSQKPVSEAQNVVPNKASSEKPMESNPKGLFVKINMDGVPIGRKVDLKAYDSYDKLSSAVDELFRGLLAAQNEPCAGGKWNKEDGEKAITGLLDGSGEYTLVYEDNEGDRMLVGDVPWHMFVSAVKRLRVLKSSELSTLRCGKQVKL